MIFVLFEICTAAEETGAGIGKSPSGFGPGGLCLPVAPRGARRAASVRKRIARKAFGALGKRKATALQLGKSA